MPFVVEEKLATWNVAMSQVLLFLSLGLLVRTSGQISLCQMGFFAIGAATFGHMLGKGVPWLLALVIAGLVAIPVGAFVAIPAIRLSGLYQINDDWNALLTQSYQDIDAEGVGDIHRRNQGNDGVPIQRPASCPHRNGSNTTAGREQAADPGEILIGEALYDALEAPPRVTPLPPLHPPRRLGTSPSPQPLWRSWKRRTRSNRCGSARRPGSSKERAAPVPPRASHHRCRG